MELTHVDGENKGKILLFALSTCGWCKQLREFIEDLNVEFDYIYVDLTEGDERDEAVNEVSKYNENLSFPTLVINDKDVVMGYEPDEVKMLLNI
ncbi:glutaredoxin family protein [Methanobrevibacter oralis]|uniref:Glutaredoxin n=1 Tax=Methanobrevibacter oralis TaxID=66851 RepID=A0A166C909_METOA|nr:glutaredoxin family protein [Methanobrevibacter oralis]KZX12337.1 glutaredoxin [Methanobrevibacter oralis]